jgi:hypothetical protein
MDACIRMNNDKKTISASEINRYVYCPFQWYYERLYGRKFLREKLRERNQALHLTDTAASNFKKGLQFHRRYLLAARLRFAVKAVLLAALIGLAVYLYFYFKGF